MNITPTQSVTVVTIEPDWQPIETIPTDGSIVRIAVEYVNNVTGEMRPYIKDVFWGNMTSYPDEPKLWVDVRDPANGLYSDSEFIKQVTLSNQYGSEETHLYYRGCRMIGWTRPWDVQFAVKYPEVDPPQFREVVYDNRKDRTSK